MRDQATRLYLRFRRRRDGAALARLFDAVAPGLLDVARHLAPDLASAEDLVQATFVIAIEHADRFDASREVKPWLYGVLTREATKARRRAARKVDPERAQSPETPPAPIDQASAQEVSAEVALALGALPPHYREVLEPFLTDGLSAPEIATKLGGSRSSGHVRMQIGRGLELLRQRLPRGLAFGAAAAAAMPRGHAGVREALVEHLAQHPLPVAVGGASAAATTKTASFFAGGLIMGKTLFASVAVALAAAAFLVTRDGQVDGLGLADPPAVEHERDVDLAATAEPDALQALDVGESVRTRAAVEAAPEPEPAAPVVDEPLRGQVVDESGHAVGGATLLAKGDSEWRVAVARDGTFAIERETAPAYVYAMHPEHAPSVVTATSNGGDGPMTLVLRGRAARATVTVMSRSGEPVPGATVRLRYFGGANFSTEGRRHVSLEPDAVLSTNALGVAAFRGLRPGQHSVDVKADGFIEFKAGLSPEIEADSEFERELTLRRGATIAGRVTSVDGPPIEGVTIGFGGKFARTDANGEYTLRGLEGGTHWLSAYGRAPDRFPVHKELSLAYDATVRWDPILERIPTVEGHLLDASGAPLAGWYVRANHQFTPGEPSIDRLTFDKFTLWSDSARTDDDGHFILRRIAAKDFVLSAQATLDYGWDEPLAVFRDVQAGQHGVVLRVQANETLGSVVGRVLHADGNAPSGMKVSLQHDMDNSFMRHAVEQDGRFELRNKEPGDYLFRLWSSNGVEIERVDIAIGRGERVDLGVLTVDRPGSALIRLEGPEGKPRGALQWWISDGSTRFTSGTATLPEKFELPPGTYELSVNCSHYTCDPIKFEIRSGQETQVSPRLDLATDITLDFVTEDGVPLTGDIDVRVLLIGSQTELQAHTAPPGRPLVLDVDRVAVTIKATASDGRTGFLSGNLNGGHLSRRRYTITLKRRD